MTYFLLDLSGCMTGRAALGVHSAGQPADERVTAVSQTGHNTLVLSPSHLVTVS